MREVLTAYQKDLSIKRDEERKKPPKRTEGG
jgi:hypothetical protein